MSCKAVKELDVFSTVQHPPKTLKRSKYVFNAFKNINNGAREHILMHGLHQTFFTGHAQGKYTIIMILNNGRKSVVFRYEIHFQPKNMVVLALSFIDIIEISKHQGSNPHC